MKYPAEIIGYITDVFAIIGGVVMFYQGYRFLILKRKYKRRLQELNNTVESYDYVLNMSGHPMTFSEDDWLNEYTVIDVKLGNVHNMERIEEFVEELMNSLDAKVLEDIKSARSIVFAFPGMSSLTQLLIPYVHSLSGRFPIITLAVHRQEGFIWKKPKDLHQYRTNIRLKR